MIIGRRDALGTIAASSLSRSNTRISINLSGKIPEKHRLMIFFPPLVCDKIKLTALVTHLQTVEYPNFSYPVGEAAQQKMHRRKVEGSRGHESTRRCFVTR